jgi:hypothetical protein
MIMDKSARVLRYLTISGALLALAVFPAYPQGGKAPVPGLSLAWLAKDSKDSLVLSVRVALPSGWYINSDKPLDTFLVPTKVEVAAAPGIAGPLIEFDPPEYPAPTVEYSKAMAGDMSLFKRSFEVRVTAKGPQAGKKRAALPSVPPPVEATLHYQSCDGTMCWPPKTVTARLASPPAR